ncbi:hypothetical protein OG393_29315 [Streptomyces sp. NBC_01216]|uniref:hypothetical protein n=1 Tax=Streptomyces sp. NBC_01216 TaxID=2903778 RepID=UPI002E130EAD|nr:hypothetical protein OG393_29315 [Streptomyces sp. NBC_01216]
MISFDGGVLYVTFTRKTNLTRLVRLLEAEAQLGLHDRAVAIYKGRREPLRKQMSIPALAAMVRAEVETMKQLRLESALKVGM